jgi:hypothetical protein
VRLFQNFSSERATLDLREERAINRLSQEPVEPPWGFGTGPGKINSSRPKRFPHRLPPAGRGPGTAGNSQGQAQYGQALSNGCYGRVNCRSNFWRSGASPGPVFAAPPVKLGFPGALPGYGDRSAAGKPPPSPSFYETLLIAYYFEVFTNNSKKVCLLGIYRNHQGVSRGKAKICVNFPKNSEPPDFYLKSIRHGRGQGDAAPGASGFLREIYSVITK